MNKIDKLLEIWYACLIDHHKDNDCYFHIGKLFCTYKEPRWFVYHEGYLYEWYEEVNTYEEGLKVLEEKLINQIKKECKYCEDYTTEQNEQLATNLLDLEALLSE